jgi:uncharacterized protein YkwD
MGARKLWWAAGLVICLVRSAAANYFDGTWDLFVQTPAAQREIDPSNVDSNLLSAAILHATNRQRVSNGLPPVNHSERARRAAGMQARIMRDRGSISHDNPERSSLKTLEDRAHAAGLKFRFLAENVATAFDRRYESGKPFYPRVEGDREIVSYSPEGPPIPRHTYASFAQAVVQSWMDSDGHRKNLLSTEPEFMGASALPDSEKAPLRKFFCAQVFFAPAAAER